MTDILLLQINSLVNERKQVVVYVGGLGQDHTIGPFFGLGVDIVSLQNGLGARDDGWVAGGGVFGRDCLLEALGRKGVLDQLLGVFLGTNFAV